MGTGAELNEQLDPRLLDLDPQQVGEDFRRRYCRPDVDIETIAQQLRPWNMLLDSAAGEPLPDDEHSRWLIECAFHITRWLQHELAQRSDSFRELARHAERVFHRIEVGMRILRDAINTLVANSALEVRALETAAREGYSVTQDGTVTVAEPRRIEAGSNPGALERRRAELESILAHLARERSTVQAKTIASMRRQLGADGSGIPSMILETQRLGADLAGPLRTITSGMPPSALRNAMEQFIADAELVQRLIGDPGSGVDAYTIP